MPENEEDPPAVLATDQHTAAVADKPALALKWTCCFAEDATGALLSLNGSEIFCPTAHVGVIYDSETRAQTR